MAQHSPRNRGLRRSSVRIAAIVQRPLDTAILGLAYYAACRVRPEPWEPSDTVAVIVSIAVFYLVAEANRLYRAAPLRREMAGVLATWGVVVPLLLFFAFLTKTSQQFSRLVTLLWFVLTPATLAISRVLIRQVAGRLQRFNRATRQVAVLGATPIGVRIAERIIADAPQMGAQLVGYYDDRGTSRREPGHESYGPVVGNVNRLIDDARAGRIDSIYIALPLRAEPRINAIVRRLADTTSDVYVVPDFLGLDLLHAQWSSVEGLAVVSVVNQPDHGVRAWLKRLEDAVTGAVLRA